MKVSLDGLIRNICEVLKKSKDPQSPGYAYMLEEMAKNMKEIQRRKEEGEKVIDEFFSLYV